MGPGMAAPPNAPPGMAPGMQPGMGGMAGGPNVMPAHMPTPLNMALQSGQINQMQYQEIGRILMGHGLAGPGQPCAGDMRVVAAVPGMVHALKWAGGPEAVMNLARTVCTDINASMGGGTGPRPAPPMQGFAGPPGGPPAPPMGAPAPFPGAMPPQPLPGQPPQQLPPPPTFPGPPAPPQPILVGGGRPPTPPWHLQHQPSPPAQPQPIAPAPVPVQPPYAAPPVQPMPGQPPHQQPPFAQLPPWQKQRQQGAMVVAGAEPKGGLAAAEEEGRPDRQRAPGTPVEGGMVMSLKRQQMVPRPKTSARPPARGLPHPAVSSAEAQAQEQAAQKSFIHGLKQQQQQQQQQQRIPHPAKQQSSISDLKQQQQQQQEWDGQQQQQQQQQQQPPNGPSQKQRQRQRQRREEEKKVLDLDALYAAGYSGAGTGTRSSAWASAMDDLGDVLDGDDTAPDTSSKAKKGAPPSAASPSKSGAAAGTPQPQSKKGQAAAGGAGGECGTGEGAHESSEAEEGELPSEEGEYVDPQQQ